MNGNIARLAIESMYTGRATVTAREKAVNKHGGTVYQEKELLTDIPCRLSHKSVVQSASDESGAFKAEKVTELITSPDITIPENSKITVTQAGRTEAYTLSGSPAVYDTHQEIILERWQKWA